MCGFYVETTKTASAVSHTVLKYLTLAEQNNGRSIIDDGIAAMCHFHDYSPDCRG